MTWHPAIAGNDTHCPSCTTATVTSERKSPAANPSGGDWNETVDSHEHAESEVETAPRQFGGYEIVAELAKGGMGVVYKARQIKLNRIVALKMILGGQLVTEAQIRRFQLEAAAAAALDHAGIVPIHEVGEYDGRHFYSMGFVEGTGLDARLAQGPMTPDDAADLMIKLAQAVAYAHGQGVIHRDLKPSNVLLDSGGQPRITDFGLAKLMHEDSGLTRSGQVLGTPSYMPPEQATGDIESIDATADVYSLGAILYALLTGRPPFRAAQVSETLRQVIDDEPVSPRQLNSVVDRDLETICLKCLEKTSLLRYHTAQEFEQELLRFRRGETILARPVGRVRRTFRWAKRHPSKAGALIASLVATSALLCIGIGVAYYRQDANHRETVAEFRRSQSEAEIRDTIDDANQLLKDLASDLSDRSFALTLHDDPVRWESSVRQSNELLQRARAIHQASGLDFDHALLGDLDNLDARVSDCSTNRQQAIQLETIRVDAYQAIDRERDLTPVAFAYEVEFRDAGWNLTSQQDFSREQLFLIATEIAESAIAWQWIAALDHWAQITDDIALQVRLLQLARLADPDPQWRDRFRDPFVWRDRVRLQELASEPAALAQSTILIGALADRLHALNGDPSRLLREALLQHPGDFWLHYVRGTSSSDPREQAGSYRAALAIRPQASPAFTNLGAALLDLGRTDEGIRCFRESIVHNPRNAIAHYNLARNLYLRNPDRHIAEVVDLYQRALQIDAGFLQARNNLATVLKNIDRHEEAVGLLEQVLANDPEYTFARVNLGQTYVEMGNIDKGIELFREAIDEQEDLFQAHANLGAALIAQQDFSAAIESFDRASRLQPDDANLRFQLGNAYQGVGQYAESIKRYREGLEIEPDVADGYYNWGIAATRMNDIDAAKDAYRRAIECDLSHANAHLNLGNLLQAEQEYDEALICFQAALRAEPEFVFALNGMGTTRQAQNRIDEAIDLFRRAIEIDSHYAEAYVNLGVALQKQGRLREAANTMRMADQIGSKRPNWPHPTGQWADSAERLADLHGRVAPTLAGERPIEDESVRIEMAELCFNYTSQFQSAYQLYADAFAAEPDFESNPRFEFRYRAACAGVLAANRVGSENTPVSDELTTQWRLQSLKWLKDELETGKQVLVDFPDAQAAIASRLGGWQIDERLATVREEKHLNRLPDDEQQQWRTLWQEVRDLQTDAGSLEI